MNDTSRSLLFWGGSAPMGLGRDVGTRLLRQAAAREVDTRVTVEFPDVPALAALAGAVDRTEVEDPAAALAWARGRRFDVVLGVREQVQVALAEVARAVGAPGNPPEAVRTVRNKDRCRQALREAGLPQPEFRLCADPASARAFLDATDGPWIVKPRDASGSLGVRKVTAPEELAEAVEAVRAAAAVQAGSPGTPGTPADAAAAGTAASAAAPPGGPEFIVEQFVQGPEYSVEGVFLGGEPRVLAVTEKKLLPPPNFVEAGHVLPAALPAGLQRAFEEDVTRALKALGLRFGVFHVELWSTEDGPVLGEVHVRNGGDWIHLMLEYAIPGLDLFGLVIDDALGTDPGAHAPAPTRAAAVRFLAAPPGRVTRITGWEDVLRHPAVLKADLTVAPGDLVGEIRESYDRAGYLVVGAESPQRAAELADRLAARVRFETAPPATAAPVTARTAVPTAAREAARAAGLAGQRAGA
ncbi:ATP-grasp domain-containing protein [Streptomyces lycii]|uniref:ATP-grasp domain-containing protein n=1 Tax=Streptomyces lycii TaxID=2654337 RepID=A0ABQ7FG17_9ACTN|nr:ATP-grasp domain-containing protein [Streptomyces lycii]KAF4407964.1 ATP-grasp domain-containing protein [Streptomyces lycii]